MQDGELDFLRRIFNIPYIQWIASDGSQLYHLRGFGHIPDGFSFGLDCRQLYGICRGLDVPQGIRVALNSHMLYFHRR